MPKLVTVSITAIVPDDIEEDAVADAIFNTADVSGFNEAFDTDVELLDSEIAGICDSETFEVV